jgi:glycosyltransferase involved in cell wall biosynthesis
VENLPLFSIVIPTYNRLQFLKRALESAYSQSYKNIEVILLDNASTDGTREYLVEISAQYKFVKVFTNPQNIGFANNIHQISKYISGKYLNILSDDDYLEKKFVEKSVKALENTPQATLWYCRACYVDKNENLLSNAEIAPVCEDGKYFVQKWLLGKRMPILVSVVYRVVVLEDIGWFSNNSEVKNAIDMTIILPCAMQGNVIYEKEILCYYTVDENNLSHATTIIDWFLMNLALYNALANILFINKRYWICFLVRFIFFNVVNLKISNFYSLWRRVFNISPWYTILYSVYYFPHSLVRKTIGRGMLFKKIQRVLYHVKNLWK